ncbi:MAG TPA: trigger factor [Halanaerobiaceae bacterium]|jgi:trigger factor|nr:trigger factor [Halanaerobiaceae bacterium]HOA39930.1 trigger factor [Halanaerobiales bacterium]HPZ62005.1 trigger factor [Halanaerobiales bacterium]HQD03271.1 trigger factor [Halanaerobiales bacterium]
MEVAKEVLEGNKVKLKVEIEKERVNDALDKAYKKVVKDVSLPGFRKGRVPRHILEARYGKEVLHSDAFDFLVPQAYMEAVKAAEIEPIDQPEIEDFYIAENEPATFTAIVQVKPEVELGQYTDLGIEKDQVNLSDDEIEEVLKRQQEQHAYLETVDRDTVEEGDFAIIDFTGFLDGEEFPGGSAEEYTLEIGSGYFIPGFEDQLVGQKVGEEVEVKVTFPEDYQAENLAGKDAVFKVNIKELKVKKVPELNDDFAREAGEFESLDELKEDIKEKLLKQKEDQVQREYEEKILEKISDNATVDVPEVLVNNELDMMLQNMNYSLSQQGVNIEQYFAFMGIDPEDWRKDNWEMAEKRAKINLVLEAIAKKEGIEVSDEEIDKRIEEMTEGSEQKPEQFKAFLMASGQLDGLVHSMLIGKVYDFLMANN